MRMEDYSKVFTKKINMDRYLPLIKAAQDAAKGDDGFPRVVLEDYLTYQEAVRAANAIRNYCKAHNIEVRASCPENGKTIRVYRSSTPRRVRTGKKKAAEPTTAATSQ